jgi:hypothetical protein
MNYFLKKLAFLFILVSSVNLFAQDDNLEDKQKNFFQPKFTLGSGIYTLSGDIQSDESGFLKGRSGFNAGMKFDFTNNIDLSFLFIKTSFFGDNGSENFSSDIDGLGLHLGYTVDQFYKQSKIKPILFLGIQKFNVSNAGNTSDAIMIPFGFGLRMDITERLEFDIALNFGLGMGDIDMTEADNADGYSSLNFSIHYDLFTPADNDNDAYFDDSYYADVDFIKLEAEDEDSDLVVDTEDYCPQTPIGVKVDENGCPLDDDKDGIPNYIDEEKNTEEGSLVDEKGVKLSKAKYQSMYSDLEVASRKYANFYNEVEIKRENYKTIDEYLIAKANAFNKAFNESIRDNSKVKALSYKVRIGEEYKDGISAKLTNKLLSLDDLESLTQKNDMVIYAVGNYTTYDEALNRTYALEDQGFDDTYVIVDNNGEISKYIVSIPAAEIDEDEVVIINDSISNQKDELTNETTYRVQIGAYNKPLLDEVFVGVKNLVSFTGKDGLVRYMAGSFIDYKDVVDYQAQMRARGFDDAFILTYKNGERISLNLAIKPSNTLPVAIKKDSNKSSLNLKFTVQIMVSAASVSSDDLKSMNKLGDITKEQSGSLYKYYTGAYSNLNEVNIQLAKAKEAGFSDAFVFATNNGKRITLEEAKTLLSKK